MTLEMAKYLALFVSEARDHLAKLGAELVQLEGAARDGGETKPIVDGLFRHAHSVKGMSGAMQLQGIATVAHRVEEACLALGWSVASASTPYTYALPIPRVT